MASYVIRKVGVSHTFLPATPPSSERIVRGYRVRVRWVTVPREEAIARRKRLVQIVADALLRERAAPATGGVHLGPGNRS